MNEEILGQNSNFFVGVVESRDDPQMIGRVKIRIFGLHDKNKTVNDTTGRGISTEDLPWAHPVNTIHSGTMSGIGETPHQLVEGCHVVGVSLDGDYYNNLLVLGTINGIHEEKPSSSKGFSDPNSEYPLDDRLKEPDTNRLARNEKIDKTIVKKKKDGIDTGVPTANGAGPGTWDEPETPYSAKYTKNHVYETESGHFQEFDDTEGAERLHRYHTTGTFEETHPDGSVVTKVVKDNFQITVSNDNIHIQGNQNITVDGNSTFYVQGNEDTQTDGNRTEHVLGTETRDVDKDQTENFGANVTINVTGNVTENINGNKDITCGGNFTVQAATINLN